MVKTKQVNNFIAFDHYGNSYKIGNNPPRKWLLEYFCRKHADKMYCDTIDGVKHIGYIITGHWLRIKRVNSWK